NKASVDRNGRHILEILKDIEDIEIKYILLPEHGLFGSDDDKLRMVGDNSFDPVTGARIVDLWGRYIKPPRWVLDDVDVVLIDLQDTGVRYTTYITTISKVMESCSEFRTPILLLDRPNPIRGDRVDGPVVRTAYQSFESYHLVPIRHGLTIGEFAIMVNEMGWVKDLARVRLVVVPVRNWKRSMWFDETQLPWISPQPTLDSLETVLGFTGATLIRGTNLNIGYGTDKPYFRFGSPWIAGQHLKEMLEKQGLPGIEISTVRYKPDDGEGKKIIPRYGGEFCSGVDIAVTDRNAFDPLQTATTLIILASRLYPREFQWTGDGYIDKLFGTSLLRTFTAQDKPPGYLPPQWNHDVFRFNQFRERFLLYE
ncbi:MAG: DUF1343 domain-containing protein, partial [Candidatus Marinimicrobia bacterium]|nr:DUF1343 domain-containing protein [Candidatus Neomarinimicrobiota bacterium]